MNPIERRIRDWHDADMDAGALEWRSERLAAMPWWPAAYMGFSKALMATLAVLCYPERFEIETSEVRLDIDGAWNRFVRHMQSGGIQVDDPAIANIVTGGIDEAELLKHYPVMPGSVVLQSYIDHLNDLAERDGRDPFEPHAGPPESQCPVCKGTEQIAVRKGHGTRPCPACDATGTRPA